MKKSTLIIIVVAVIIAFLAYISFVAFAAKKVSGGVLDEFVFMNDSLEKTNEAFSKRTDSILLEMKKQRMADSVAKAEKAVETMK